MTNQGHPGHWQNKQALQVQYQTLVDHYIHLVVNEDARSNNLRTMHGGGTPQTSPVKVTTPQKRLIEQQRTRLMPDSSSDSEGADPVIRRTPTPPPIPEAFVFTTPEKKRALSSSSDSEEESPERPKRPDGKPIPASAVKKNLLSKFYRCSSSDEENPAHSDEYDYDYDYYDSGEDSSVSGSCVPTPVRPGR